MMRRDLLTPPLTWRERAQAWAIAAGITAALIVGSAVAQRTPFVPTAEACLAVDWQRLHWEHPIAVACEDAAETCYESGLSAAECDAAAHAYAVEL